MPDPGAPPPDTPHPDTPPTDSTPVVSADPTPHSGVAVPPGNWGLGEVFGGIIASQFLAALCTVIAMAIAGWDRPSQIPMWGLAVLQIPLWAGWMGAVAVAGRKGNGIVTDFGFTIRPVDVPLGLTIGVALQLVLVPIVYFPILRLSGLTNDDLSKPAHALADRAHGWVGWVLLFLLVGIGAPVVEELFYRGLLQRALIKRGLPPWLSVLLGAALFSAMHLEPLQFVGLFLFGAVSGWLALRTRRLGPSIAAHVGFNTTTVVTLLLLRGR